MRLHVLYDAEGHIFAASEADIPWEDGGVVPIPVPSKPGQTVTTLEVPSESEARELDDICRRLRVDAEGKRLVPLDTSAT